MMIREREKMNQLMLSYDRNLFTEKYPRALEETERNIVDQIEKLTS